jgi:hypothetical protein
VGGGFQGASRWVDAKSHSTAGGCWDQPLPPPQSKTSPVTAPDQTPLKSNWVSGSRAGGSHLHLAKSGLTRWPQNGAPHAIALGLYCRDGTKDGWMGGREVHALSGGRRAAAPLPTPGRTGGGVLSSQTGRGGRSTSLEDGGAGRGGGVGADRTAQSSAPPAAVPPASAAPSALSALNSTYPTAP